MKLPIYEIIDIQPGEILDSRHVCLPLQDYKYDDYVVWLKDPNGNVLMRETFARHRPFAVNVAIKYRGQLFKAAMTSGCLMVLDARMKWLTGH